MKIFILTVLAPMYEDTYKHSYYFSTLKKLEKYKPKAVKKFQQSPTTAMTIYSFYRVIVEEVELNTQKREEVSDKRFNIPSGRPFQMQ